MSPDPLPAATPPPKPEAEPGLEAGLSPASTLTAALPSPEPELGSRGQVRGLLARDAVTLEWIRDVGGLLDDQLRARDDDVLNSPVRNGVTLCSLLLALGLAPVSYVVAPKSLEEAWTNWERGLAVLRARTDVDPRYLWATEEFITGDEALLFGLFNELRRVFGGSAQASSSESEWIRGEQSPRLRSRAAASARQLLQWIRALGCIDSTVPLNSLGEAYLISEASRGTLLCDLVGVVLGIELRGVMRHPRTLTSQVSNVRLALEALRTVTDFPHAYLSCETEIGSGDAVAIFGLLRHMYDTFGGQASEMAQATEATEAPSPARDLPLSPKRGSPGRSTATDADLTRELLDWLHKLGFGGLSSNDLAPASLRPLFSDGTFLTDVVAAVEGGPLPGVHTSPRTHAEAMHNITLALDKLRANKRMPWNHLWSPHDVQAGNAHLVLPLLHDIRAAYGDPRGSAALLPTFW